jgi:hypothetical protein
MTVRYLQLDFETEVWSDLDGLYCPIDYLMPVKELS